MNKKNDDKVLSSQDAKLLTEFFTLLAEWDAASEKEEQMKSQQENRSASLHDPSLEASLNSLRS